MAFATAQPVCTFCRNLNYDQAEFYVQAFPAISGLCCICGKMRDRICYMRLDPLKVPYPKVRVTTPRRKKNHVPKPHR